jgi:hypothetical protein
MKKIEEGTLKPCPAIRVIRLPNGHAVRLGVYVRAWRTLKNADPNERIGGFDYEARPAHEILTKMRAGLDDRINPHISGYDCGRKWSPDWQRQMIQTAQRLNTPRLAIDWLPLEFRERFGHRLRERKE